MIEHVSVAVKDFKKARKFYIAALKPLKYKINYDFKNAAGFMADGHTSFWIVRKLHREKIHVAFLAKNKKMVHDFHSAGLAAGGKDNGKPGPREEYSPDYYASFILDPDGNNIEAVWYDKKAK